MMNPIKKDKSNKSKIEIARRDTAGKKKPDLFAKFRNTEHPLDSMMPSEEKPASVSPETLDKVKSTSPDIATITLPYPSLVEATLPDPTRDYPILHQQKNNQQSVSPAKNFTKVPNSIIKQAIPEGLFKGQSKHTYDVLYQFTRGAITPKRSIQLPKSELVKLTGLESKTIQRHLSHLRTVGLIIVDPKIGDHNGAIYTVNIPEEITLPYPTLVGITIPKPSVGEASTKRLPNPSINSTTVGQGNQLENKEVSESANTSLKTRAKIDDEFTLALEVFRVIGKGKRESWRELAELLKAEFEIASSRTDFVSDAPAFLAEHLRRRLIAKPPRTEKAKHFEPGKDEPIIEAEVFTPEPLSEEGREVVLNNLRRMPREAANEYENHYTAEDWTWLVEKLG
jgi:hypothetical protein